MKRLVSEVLAQDCDRPLFNTDNHIRLIKNYVVYDLDELPPHLHTACCLLDAAFQEGAGCITGVGGKDCSLYLSTYYIIVGSLDAV